MAHTDTQRRVWMRTGAINASCEHRGTASDGVDSDVIRRIPAGTHDYTGTPRTGPVPGLRLPRVTDWVERQGPGVRTVPHVAREGGA